MRSNSFKKKKEILNIISFLFSSHYVSFLPPLTSRKSQQYEKMRKWRNIKTSSGVISRQEQRNPGLQDISPKPKYICVGDRDTRVYVKPRMDREPVDTAIFMQIPAARRLNAFNHTHAQTLISPSSELSIISTHKLWQIIYSSPSLSYLWCQSPWFMRRS